MAVGVESEVAAVADGVTAVVPPVPPSSDPGGMTEVKYIVLQFYLVTFCAGLIGNTLVLYVITKYDEIRTRSVSNYYIWNLALADQLFVFSLPFFCYATWTGDWIFGTWTCKVSNKLAFYDVIFFSFGLFNTAGG